MINKPSIPFRCNSFLKEWKRGLTLTSLEQDKYKKEIELLDSQLYNLRNKHIKVAVFGRVGVGKSSLLNSLVKKRYFKSDVVNGSTVTPQSCQWGKSFKDIKSIELIDTPGIDEVLNKKQYDIAYETAFRADLILFVIDSDLTSIEQNALKVLLAKGKQILLVLNRSDQWDHKQIKVLKNSIKNRLPSTANHLKIISVAAAARQPKLFKNGRVRSQIIGPQVSPLVTSIIEIVEQHGELLLAINALQQADRFHNILNQGRLKRNKASAQSVIGKFAVIKASGVAVNPFLIFDLATGIACDTALIVQLSKVYGLKLESKAARELLKQLSIYSSLLGGTQVCIQVALRAIQSFLLFAAPFTGGLSLASTGPIALAQAALAIYTTQITGRLAAKKFLKGNHQRSPQPSLLLRRLAINNPQVKMLLHNPCISKHPNKDQLQALLP